MLWANGALKSAAPDSQIGVHNASVELADGTSTGAYSYATNTPMAKYLAARGAPASVLGYRVATASDSIHWQLAIKDDAGGLNVNPPSPISNEYLEAIRQESSAEWECRHRAMAAQVYPGIMPDDLFPIPSPRVDQPDNQGPEGNTP